MPCCMSMTTDFCQLCPKGRRLNATLAKLSLWNLALSFHSGHAYRLSPRELAEAQLQIADLMAETQLQIADLIAHGDTNRHGLWWAPGDKVEIPGADELRLEAMP